MKKAALLLALALLLSACGAGGTAYRVEAFSEEAGSLGTTLYVATVEMPETYYENLTAYGIGTSNLGAPVAFFSLEGNDVEPSGVFYLPNLGGNGISGFYIVSGNTGADTSLTYSQSYTEKLHALARLTGEDAPLYLVSDGLLDYAVIGSTAYYIGYVTADLPEQLEFSLPDDVTVAVIAV